MPERLDRTQGLAELARRNAAAIPGPIDLVERTPPTPPPPLDEYAPVTGVVIACLSIGLGGALACIAAALWLASHLPAVHECPL